MADRHDELAQTWLAAMGPAMEQTLRHNPGSTITPPMAQGRTTMRNRALSSLGHLSTDSARLELEATIGQGGMGVVHEACQVALGRTVAVKTLRADSRTDEARVALLREAWITGSLEHPNVVPVHDICLDEDGQPLIVLKRIEGVSWSELIRDSLAVRERFGNEDLLAWNLDILLQVINAVRFAHSRGIVHRDLKPDNVMIGAFGEVYVLDWGLAVSLGDDQSGRLPLARDAVTMAGSPFYMAPEMLGDGAPISERTDVYLLGALLYEIIAGKPPHQRASAMAILRSIAKSDPEIPEDAPDLLARMCQRAMAPKPDARHASAAEFHEQITQYLRYRGSARLADKALADLDALLTQLGRSPPRRAATNAEADMESSADTARQNIYRLFGACRFGFREALSAWSGNQAATEGLERALAAMADYELASGQPRAAMTLLHEMAAPPEDLRERIAEALRARGQERQRLANLEKLRADLDPSTGALMRTVFSAVLAVLFICLPLIVQWADLVHLINYPVAVGLTAFFAALIGLLFVIGHETMTMTAINRRIVASMVLIVVAQAAVELAFWLIGLHVLYTGVFLMLIWSLTAALVALIVAANLWPGALGFLICFLLSAWYIEWLMYCLSACNLVFLANLIAVRGNLGAYYHAGLPPPPAADVNPPGRETVEAPEG